MFWLVQLLVPIGVAVVLPIAVVAIVFKSAMASERNRKEIILAALEKNPNLDVEDLVKRMKKSEKLIKAYLSSAGYRDEGKFRAWLFTIARNTFLNHKASTRTLDDLKALSTMPSAATADSAFRHQELYMALATLSPKERSSVVMFYMSGYSIKEIAGITSSSEDAVKKQLSRGRDNLKTILNV